MLIKLLTKLGFSGGAMAGTIFVIEPTVINEKEIKEVPTEGNFKMDIEQIKTLVDIEIFAKQNKCTFGFVNSWATKKINKAEEFVNEAIKGGDKNKNGWIEAIITGIKRGKEQCKNNSALIFFNGDTGFHLTGPKK